MSEDTEHALGIRGHQYYTCPTRGPIVINIRTRMQCPFCPSESNFHSDIRGLYGTASLLSGWFFHNDKIYLKVFYKCCDCGEEFTTTESDTVSMQGLFGNRRKQIVVEMVKSILNKIKIK